MVERSVLTRLAGGEVVEAVTASGAADIVCEMDKLERWRVLLEDGVQEVGWLAMRIIYLGSKV